MKEEEPRRVGEHRYWLGDWMGRERMLTDAMKYGRNRARKGTKKELTADSIKVDGNCEKT